MCGIAGILGPDDPVRVDKVNAMVAAIAHRGPDARVTKSYPGAALGHARLTIIDVSERALQPMMDQSGRYIVVFNGEIYNYKELRHELSDRCQFMTTSDTEVLLNAFVTWGEGCLDHIIGMFAFCIYDQRNRQAFFARDRFGQKPLFFYEDSKDLYFSSEIKGLFAAGAVRKANKSAWAQYMAHARVDEGADTFFDGIWQLRPGESAWYSPGQQLKTRQYYKLEDHIEHKKISFEEASADVRDLMVDAVSIHMRSDVPVGISLSGGLDSSAILSCLQLGNGIPEHLACFSVEYGKDQTERPWIDAAAQWFGLKSIYGTFSREKFHASMKRAIWHQEAPIGGLPNSGLEEVAKAARTNGVSVLQDGTGLDEAFGGYRNHQNLYLGLLLQEGSPMADQAVAEYAKNWGVDENTALQAGLAELKRSGTAIDGSVPTRPDFLMPEYCERIEDWRTPSYGDLDPLRNSLVHYLQSSKIPRNMRMKDRATMAFGIELRLPFLDHRLVEYALSLPAEYYFKHGWSKSIVREALSGSMDDAVRLAPKRSIQAPQELWLRTDPMQTYIRELLSSASFASRGIVDPHMAIKAYEAFCIHGAENSFFVWQWINMEEWFRTFIDNDPITMPHPACAEVSGLVH